MLSGHGKRGPLRGPLCRFRHDRAGSDHAEVVVGQGQARVDEGKPDAGRCHRCRRGRSKGCHRRCRRSHRVVVAVAWPVALISKPAADRVPVTMLSNTRFSSSIVSASHVEVGDVIDVRGTQCRVEDEHVVTVFRGEAVVARAAVQAVGTVVALQQLLVGIAGQVDVAQSPAASLVSSCSMLSSPASAKDTAACTVSKPWPVTSWITSPARTTR